MDRLDILGGEKGIFRGEHKRECRDEHQRPCMTVPEHDTGASARAGTRSQRLAGEYRESDGPPVYLFGRGIEPETSVRA